MLRNNVKFMKYTKNILATEFNETNIQNNGKYIIDPYYNIYCNNFDETSTDDKIMISEGGDILRTIGQFIEGDEVDYTSSQ